MEFVHDNLAQRVLFGSGRAADNLREELQHREITRPMMILSERHRQLGDTATSNVEVSTWWNEIAQHVPVELVDRATAVADSSRADGLVCIGGGSTTGLAKAIALRTALPVVSVPTTYAGSEATNVWGVTENRVKTTGVDNRVLPVTVIYDAQLLRGLSTDLSVASALNALAHCVDSLWAPRADPINRALAIEAARLLALALRGLAADGEDLASLENALCGCYLAGVAFASAGSGLHHKICHVLGGTFDLPHAQTHAVVLPHVLAFNAPGVPDRAALLAQAIGAPADKEPVQAVTAGMRDLYEAVDAPTALSDFGFSEDGVSLAVDRVLAVAPPSNPVPVTERNLTVLLRNAQSGLGASPKSESSSRGGSAEGPVV